MILYLVSRNAERLVSAIAKSSLPKDPILEIRQVVRAPAGKENREQVVAVLDLVCPPPGMRPPLFSTDARITYVLLAARDQSLPLPWVEFHKSAHVELVTLNPGRESASIQSALSSVLSRLVGTHSPERIAASLVISDPRLLGLETTVAAILTNPWQVRDPADLARAMGCLEASLREKCHAIGLKRIEHFVTLIRFYAFQLLRTEERMSARRARLIVGISDPSNFRRQLGRAHYFAREQG